MGLPAYCYIQEQTSSPEDYRNFGYEVVDLGSRFYLKFPAVLQSFDVMNRNRRVYEAANIMDRIQNDDYIQSMLRQNSWMGEIDHPAPEYMNEELTMQRIVNPDPKRTSHYIRSPRLNGNLLEASIQTDSSNQHGMNMAIKIVDGKIIPCFSARVLGELRTQRGRKPTVFVKKLICYDWVLYPSHREAMGKIVQPIQESVHSDAEKHLGKIIKFPELAKMSANNSKETELLCEAFGLTIDDVIGLNSDGDIVIEEGSNIYMQPISDKHIKDRTKNMLRDWLNR